MKESKADILLHPVRLKIMQEFLGGRRFTAKDLIKRLPSIPQATLYRHLDKLLQHQVLEVIEENPIRGTVEKVYSLNLAGAHLSNDDLKNRSREEHLNDFTVFIMQLLKNYEDYLSQESIDFAKDGVGYRQVGLYLSDEEFTEFLKDISHAFQKVMNNEPSEERKKRLITTIIIPERGN